MKRVLLDTIATVAILGGMFGAAAGTVFSVDQHIATVVCHWTPAHGGWYVDIVVDDDGADGNANLEAHAGHENDVINPEGGVCPGGDED